MEHMEYITKEELKKLKGQLEKQFEEVKAKGIHLDMSRGKETTVSEYSRYSGYVRLRNAQGLSDYHCDQECFGYCRDSWQSNLERL